MKKQPRKIKLADILPKYTLGDVIESEADFEFNIAIIDAGLEKLSLRLGRKLTEHEQCVLLDIVDEYTPKNSDGDYISSLIPFDYAWKIYKIRKFQF